MKVEGKKRPRIGFIVQRAGVEVNGGAESHCLQVAQRMGQHWNTEVLTTCALDYMTWENSYPEGVEQAGLTVIRRFPVDKPRDVEAFNRLSAELHSRQETATLAEQERWMRAQGPVSTALLSYLRNEEHSYDAFIFFGYLYATTYFGLPLTGKKAFLAPLAHDEWTIYFSMWEKLFSLPRALIFNTPTEREFLQKRFPNLSLTGPTIGVGIEAPAQVRPGEFRALYRLHEPFLFYLGRIDESKGCREMIDYYLRARREGLIKHKLVLAGKEVMPIPFHDDIISLGFLDEEEKWGALAACDWLLMPSKHESLSMVLLEAWQMQRPALVNGQCDVLRVHCERSNGGLWYDNEDEWIAALTCVDETTKQQLGRQGQTYVQSSYSWDRVERDYLNLLS
jgi:glycosyltransferase involved in cell wall biosynthesis